MKLQDLFNVDEEFGYFVLDSHQEAMKRQEHNHTDEDFQSYNYNIHSYNKLKEGSVCLFRRPKKSSTKRKFYFYGIAIVEQISKPDSNGFVNAKLKKAVKLTPPIFEDDKVLLQYRESKTPGKKNWVNFWNQYGMNSISKEWFIEIIKDRTFVDANDVATIDSESTIDEREEQKQISDKYSAEEFVITNTSTSLTTHSAASSGKIRVRKINFEELNKRKNTIGTLGELIVLKMETEKLKGTGLVPKYVANIEGDGLGYDIESYDENHNKLFIEVKTTTKNKIDGFYLSDNELKVSKEKGNKYRIYRIYKLDTKKKTACCNVINKPLTSELFNIVPKNYIIYIK